MIPALDCNKGMIVREYESDRKLNKSKFKDIFLS